MGKKHPFTEEQICALEANPYTHSVTPNALKFTLEFKEFFYDQVVNQRKTTPKVLKAAGYDPGMFTRANLDSIRRSILREAASSGGLRPPTGLSKIEKLEVFEKKNLELQRTSTSIKELQERILHLEKQVELLKKKERIIRKYNQKE